jgi:PAS domain S-box-containing protein
VKEQLTMNANERDLVQRFVDDMTDYAIVILDVQGRVLTWNAGARALFGYTSDDMVGRRFTVLHTKADNLLGKPETALGDALQWGRHDATGPMLRKDGSRLQARLILRPLSDTWQRHVGFGLLAYDVEGGAKPAAADEPKVPAAASPAARAKILVVDDNSGVLEEATDQLTRLGYDVVSASNGAEALAVLERGEKVDLLFTDVVMPGDLAGRDLADKAVELRPGLKVLFASGYFEGALVSKGALETDVQFIAKPYRMKALAQKVEEVLGS